MGRDPIWRVNWSSHNREAVGGVRCNFRISPGSHKSNVREGGSASSCLRNLSDVRWKLSPPMFAWGLSPVGWGYSWVSCNVYWLVRLSLNIEKKAATVNGSQKKSCQAKPWELQALFPLLKTFLFITLYNALCSLLASALLCRLIIFQIIIFTFLHPFLSLPCKPATLHCLSTPLRLTAISGDAAIKDEPVTISQALLPPLRVMDLVQSLDNFTSDGQQETITHIFGLWVPL